eukprot:scaffold14515_cov117-Isochrysis_galbana.AAC.1
MTDSPIDDTEAREQDAPGTTDAKRRAPVHGHTGDVPSDKALSDTRGRSWTDLVQSPDVAAGASSCKGGSLAVVTRPTPRLALHPIPHPPASSAELHPPFRPLRRRSIL